MSSIGSPGWECRGRASAGAFRDEPGLSTRFVLYVEGARDRGILQVWARRLCPALGRGLSACTVILGGRRPQRAREHFRELGGVRAGVSGLTVLDRDDGSDGGGTEFREPGLEFYTWGRRHIESYVLVPEAIRRSLSNRFDAALVKELVGKCLPPARDEEALRRLNAKQLLGARGPLGRGLGRAICPLGVARCMRVEEMHPDVLGLYERVRVGLGLRRAPERIVRHRGSG